MYITYNRQRETSFQRKPVITNYLVKYKQVRLPNIFFFSFDLASSPRMAGRNAMVRG